MNSAVNNFDILAISVLIILMVSTKLSDLYLSKFLDNFLDPGKF